MIRLAYIIERFPSLEYFILNEIIELEKRGFIITVFSLRKPKSGINIKESGLKSEVVYLSRFSCILMFYNFVKKARSLSHVLTTYFKNSEFSFTFLLKFFRNSIIALGFADIIKQKKITHIHAHFAFISTDIAIILSKMEKTCFSFSAHAQDIYLNKKNIIEKIKEASFVVTCTKFNVDYLNQITEYRYINKIHLIYHGIRSTDVVSANPVKFKDNIIQIVSVARLVEKKGLNYLIKAIDILNNKGVKIMCTIIGEGPLKNEFTELAKKKNIDDKVEFKGSQSRAYVLETLSKSDIFVLPCVIARNGDMDGIPNVLLEAMLNEVPVISTTISAIPELIQNGENGILVPPNNENAIAYSILELYSDINLYNKLAKQGKEKIVKDFNITDSAVRLKKLFNTVNLVSN